MHAPHSFYRYMPLAIVVSVTLFAQSLLAAEPSPERTASDAEFKSAVLPVVHKYCADCHGEDDPEGDFSIHDLRDPKQILANRENWEKAYRHLGIGGMPPKDHDDRPTRAQQQAVAAWLHLKLHRVDCEVVDDAGRVTVHRLNRTEYNNTVRDLLGVDIDPAADFPSDDVGYGFSNIADVLSLSPLQVEKYVDASEAIAAAAIVTNAGSGQTQSFGPDKLQTDGQASRREQAVWMHSTGAAICKPKLDSADQYVIRVEAIADQAGSELAKVEIRVDGKAIKTFEVKGHLELGDYECEAKLSAGNHVIAAVFVNDYYEPKARNPRDRDRNLGIRSIELKATSPVAPTKVHQQIIFTKPSKDKSVAQAASEILRRLMSRAYRRPVTDDEVKRLVNLVEFATKRGDSFERGIQVALQGVLVSPHFLFRVEDVPPTAKGSQPINDFELASRLSYFLWSSMPDNELLRIAHAGKLHETKVLDEQITRMLADPKAEALVQNFASQWLNLSNLVEVKPDAKLFPEFTPELRADMIAETQMFAREIFKNDRSLLDFIDADYTFANERLAKHYGIEGVKGSQLRRVTLPGKQRAGVLTHGSILTLTSNPDRTSLVRRGAWVLDNILGVKLPDPPATVQSLEDGAKESGAKSLLEQLKLHRADPTCAACHDTLDPLGFGFENFGPIGRWRTMAEGMKVESGGIMPSGESFSGPVELVQILKKRSPQVAELVANKMMTYALGRGLDIPDACAIDDILVDLKKNDYRFTVLVRGIVHSKPFLMRGSNQPTVTSKP